MRTRRTSRQDTETFTARITLQVLTRRTIECSATTTSPAHSQGVTKHTNIGTTGKYGNG